MVHKHNILKLSVKFEDVFHLKNLYKMMREWLKDNYYTDPERGGLELNEGELTTKTDIPEQYMETFYLEKIAQKGIREVWVWWRTGREMSSYIHRRLDINVHVLGMKDVEVMVKGHKFKSQKGEVEVMIEANILTDPYNKWEKNPLMGKLVNFFRKRILKTEWEKQVEDFAKDTYRLQEDIKKYLQIQSVSPTETFHPVKGI